MNHSELIARLRKSCDDVRRKPFPIADLIPLIQEAADALQALERMPMTEEQRRAWLPVGLLTTEELYYFRGLRDAEAFHNITPSKSKVSG